MFAPASRRKPRDGAHDPGAVGARDQEPRDHGAVCHAGGSTSRGRRCVGSAVSGSLTRQHAAGDRGEETGHEHGGTRAAGPADRRRVEGRRLRKLDSSRPTRSRATRSGRPRPQSARTPTPPPTPRPPHFQNGPPPRRTRAASCCRRPPGCSRERAEHIAGIVTQETGGTFGWGMFNTQLRGRHAREAASQTTAVTGEVIPSDVPGLTAFGDPPAAGVVLGIAPWNAPVILGTRAMASRSRSATP